MSRGRATGCTGRTCCSWTWWPTSTTSTTTRSGDSTRPSRTRWTRTGSCRPASRASGGPPHRPPGRPPPPPGGRDDLSAILHERKRQAVRSYLSGVALELLTDRDFESVTVDEIAAAAGVSRRSFFRYFASKEDVVLQYLDQMAERLRDAIVARPAGEPPVAAGPAGARAREPAAPARAGRGRDRPAARPGAPRRPAPPAAGRHRAGAVRRRDHHLGRGAFGRRRPRDPRR